MTTYNVLLKSFGKSRHKCHGSALDGVLDKYWWAGLCLQWVGGRKTALFIDEVAAVLVGQSSLLLLLLLLISVWFHGFPCCCALFSQHHLSIHPAFGPMPKI
jgi:hypothetical protein